MKNPKCEKEYGDYYKTYYMSDDEKDIDMTFNILVLDDDSYNSYASDAGISNSGDKAILINKGVYTIYDDKAEKYINKELRQFDYKAGDTLKCEYSTDSGQSDDKDRDISQLTESVDITLTGVTDVRPLGYEKSYDTPLIVMNKDSFDGLWQDRACDYSYNINQNAYIITSDADKYQDELEKELDDMTSESGFSYYIENQDRNMKQEKSLFTLVGIFAYGFIVVIALIGITNIINTLGTSMELRSREFATLRSIGMTDKQFYKMVRLESLFISVKSLVIGVPAGLVITYIINVMENRMDTVVVYVLPVKAVIMCAIVVIVLIYAIMNLSMSKIRHQNVIETIKNENL